jgi:hypothetical protein
MYKMQLLNVMAMVQAHDQAWNLHISTQLKAT